MKVSEFFSTTIGQKFIVAITGFFMIFFLLAHLAGNLEIFFGPNAVNQYAAFLRTIPKTLWTFRILLIVSVIAHIWVTVSLTNKNRKARQNGYALKKSRKANFFSRTMMVSGLTILVFIAYHLAHYTIGLFNPEFMQLTDEKGRHHVYNMMVMGFSHPMVSGLYILAQILLAFHLTHGVSSAARTLGFTNGVVYERLRISGMIFAAVIAMLYISIPFAVLLNFIPLDY
jgi:succinate dehydrogenase / fumarate reductase, cytochrome b subunit